MIPEIKSIKEYTLHRNGRGTIYYFSHDDCQVCKVLKPKIKNLLETTYPEMNLFYVDVRKNPEIAGQERIFAVPTIIVIFDGRETFRRSRNIGIQELAELLHRPYTLCFG